ncbi:ANTAR domain-containing protein [Streptomyces sp. NPDC056132]|uniref:ANTAR domain-containing protein n=1 Tax=Streptomyces sp. NPDC056132 TaxID=3345722 RepID=UPI0035D97F4F
MHVLGCEAEQAFGLLRAISQRTNRKLAECAECAEVAEVAEVAEAVVRAKGRDLESELSALAGPGH